MTVPPPRGRARLRGEAIRALAGRRDCCADWQFVRDEQGRTLDLSDPLAATAEWLQADRRDPMRLMLDPGDDRPTTPS